MLNRLQQHKRPMLWQVSVLLETEHMLDQLDLHLAPSRESAVIPLLSLLPVSAVVTLWSREWSPASPDADTNTDQAAAQTQHDTDTNVTSSSLLIDTFWYYLVQGN